MLKDKYQRKINYLRISLTDKCNLRCRYCIPPEGIDLLPHDEVLRNEEFVHMIEIFAGLGVRKIRFTGGEPLVRKGCIDIIERTRELFPEMDICLTTNGTLLEGVLDSLRDLGVRKINISLDTLDRERYRAITGRDGLSAVLSAIERAREYRFFSIKINAVLFRETLEELGGLVEYASSRELVLRFIERMPFLGEGEDQQFVPASKLEEELSRIGELRRDVKTDTSVALMYELVTPGGRVTRIGIIPPMTHKFCSQCNRLRLTCDGRLKTCLYSQNEYDLKKPYRQDMGDDSIRKIILDAVDQKPREHRINCVEYGSQGCASLLSIRSMSKIGG
ncbi:MAG: GTP 3',8-cyclase MoaA [Spirochaetes bacterium]|nr:GTP 3',8-cyclase MoaA [Spirochaetota bacterium]